MASKMSSSIHQRASSSSTKSNVSIGGNYRLPNAKKKSTILTKEQEYLKLNAELEAKTASLIKEAEDVLQDQEQLLSKPNISVDDNSSDVSSTLKESDGHSAREKRSQNITQSEYSAKVKENASKQQKRPTSAKAKSNSYIRRPKSRQSTTSSRQSVRMEKLDVENCIEDVIKVENLLNDRIQLANTISILEDETEESRCSTAMNEDILPQGNEDLSSEAVTRFLKAKIRVMQEELDRISADLASKDEKIIEGEQKNKELKDELARTQKNNQGLQTQSEKYKRLYEDSKQKCEGLESQLVSLRKELDNVLRDQKQAIVTKNAVEVRLNRALEDVEKHKASLQKTKISSKDASDHEKKRSQQLEAENKRLEKQKSELMTAFKKQMKLIDILKRQKMHIEAARMLSFTEDEFVKALDWPGK